MKTASIRMNVGVFDMSFEHSGDEPFSLDDLTKRCRNGSFPEGYVDAMLARQQRIHGSVFKNIEELIELSEATGEDDGLRF